MNDQSLGVLKYKKKWEFHSDVHEHLEVVEDVFHVAAGFLVQRLTDEEGELQWDSEDDEHEEEN